MTSEPSCTLDELPLPELLDLERLRIFETLSRATGADVVAELGGTFLAGLGERLGMLGQALDAGDLPEVGFLAHRLKGSAENLGATALGEAAGRLEQAAAAGELGRCRELRALVSQTGEATKRELVALLSKPRAAEL